MSTDTTALEVAATLPTEVLESLLQQKQSQKPESNGDAR